MKKYKVIALSVGSKSSKIFYSNDIVTEDAFDEGLAPQLVEQGFLKEYDEDEEKLNEGVSLNEWVDKPNDIVAEDAPVNTGDAATVEFKSDETKKATNKK